MTPFDAEDYATDLIVECWCCHPDKQTEVDKNLACPLINVAPIGAIQDAVHCFM